MNKLSTSTSPYLLQHAHNPVDWHQWGEEALSKAKAENKPIFLSIGYSACHWCHVMSHESFEDPEVAAFMNEHYINIKVDREERPDLDAIYMQATVAMTGSGGWPMSVFLTPDLKPFYAGTYFPPVPRYNMPAFRDVLAGIANTWQKQPDEAARVGDEVSSHLRQTLSVNVQADSASVFTQSHLNAAVKSLIDSYDWSHGGWGSAPKFPQPMTIEFLLRIALPKEHRDNVSGAVGADEAQHRPSSADFAKDAQSSAQDEETLKPALHALQAMARGGMYDVVGGGFSRYSTDNFWRVPHFEKMLYDNAQLARAYLHAWQITGDPFFKQIVVETLNFIEREMTHPDGGFYSSLDADSEGEEGKFYVWTLDEIRTTLKDDSDFFEAAYGITAKGNFEGHTILQRALDDASLAARFGIDLETVSAKLTDCHSKLLSVRTTRIRPGTDDKVLTSWNGLMLATIAEAARYLDSGSSLPFSDQQVSPQRHSDAGRLQRLATRNAEFLLGSLRPNPSGKLKHSWRDGKTTSEVFLEDYAALILGLLELYQTDFNNKWFTSAKELANEMIELFEDPHGGFYDTAKDGEVLLLRPKDVQDNATPSGNALACEALLKLAAFTDEGRYRDLAEKALGLVVDMSMRYPTAFGRWLSAADFALGKTKQVAVMVEADLDQASALIGVVRSAYRPNLIIAASTFPPQAIAPSLLKDRPRKNGMATVYVCEGFVCKNPVTTILELQSLI